MATELMNTINYAKELDKRIDAWQAEGVVPSILLHSCCAPCSSACLEVLTKAARVTVFYFNPNITNKDEYEFRLAEQKRLIQEMPFDYPVDIIAGRYEPAEFLQMAAGLEDAPERGPRCHKCYRLRLEETAKVAREGSFDFFATTLTLSPLKPADVINAIGMELSAIYLPTDFKKNNGYKRSIELSKEYNLYRQNYCGCEFSKRQSGSSR